MDSPRNVGYQWFQRGRDARANHEGGRGQSWRIASVRDITEGATGALTGLELEDLRLTVR